jgi:hypothetical protein
MNKESVFSILRSILTAVGAYLVGKNFLGATIDNELWMGIIGAIVTLGSVIWGIFDKTAGVEQIQSGLRSSIIFFGTLLVGSGVIKDEVLQSVLAVVATLVPILYSEVTKKKNKDIATGKIGIADLSGVDVRKTTITPAVTTPPKQ